MTAATEEFGEWSESCVILTRALLPVLLVNAIGVGGTSEQAAAALRRGRLTLCVCVGASD